MYDLKKYHAINLNKTHFYRNLTYARIHSSIISLSSIRIDFNVTFIFK